MIKYICRKNDFDKTRFEVLSRMNDILTLKEWCEKETNNADFEEVLCIIETGESDGKMDY